MYTLDYICNSNIMIGFSLIISQISFYNFLLAFLKEFVVYFSF